MRENKLTWLTEHAMTTFHFRFKKQTAKAVDEDPA